MKKEGIVLTDKGLQRKRKDEKMYNSKRITREDLINSLLDYFTIRLRQTNLNDLKELAYQIIIRENKILEKKVYQIYRQTINKQARQYKERFNELN